jgi:hypothetical protein
MTPSNLFSWTRVQLTVEQHIEGGLGQYVVGKHAAKPFFVVDDGRSHLTAKCYL